MRRPPKILTPARRKARAAVWLVFALILFVRFVLLREERHVGGQNPFAWQQEQRFRRAPTPVNPPVAQVPPDLPRIHIQITPQDVNSLRGYFWNGWRGQQKQQRPEVLVTVREAEATYTNVALHLKGAAGSFRPFDDKPALTLNFSKHAQGQRFHGYSKISLNNSVQDPTFICEALCRELFNAAGVPAPEASWATVLINDRDLGLYVMVEGYSKEFLRHHFKDTKGNLYDCGFVQDIDGAMDVNSGEHPDDRSDLERLAAATAEPTTSARWARLNETLDIDRFISLLALEVIMCHWDGYGMNRNNYRLFHDLATDRMVFMPHGLDQMFDYPPGRFSADGSIQPHMKGRVAAAVMSTPEGARLFLERMAVLQTKLFKEEVLIGRVHEFDQRLRPTLAAYNPSMAEWHDSAVASLCDRISRRVRSVSQQLSKPRAPLDFDSSGTVALTNWSRTVGQGSGLRLDTVQEEGHVLLRLSTANRGGSGSWRTRVYLSGGRYRFEGRVKASPEANGGAVCLRMSGDRTPAVRIAGTDWTPLSYTFDLGGLGGEVVLVCEFSASRGEVWFDADSLRLTRE